MSQLNSTPAPSSRGKFDAVFAKRTFTPVEQIAPALTPNMNALRHARHGDYGRPLPRRHFAELNVLEQMTHGPWLMWVRERSANGPWMRSSLWRAPDAAVFYATAHGTAAPGDAELLSAGWQRWGGQPIKQDGPAD